MFHHRLLILCYLVIGVAGCSSTRQIRTAPPQSAISVTDTTDQATLAPLVIVMETGRTVLPDDVEAMQFRVAEVRLKQAGGDWVTYPAEVNNFVLAANKRAQKPVLSTLVSPAAYDSLALSLTDIFVQFDANTGGPLTMPRDAPLRLPLTTTLAVGRRTVLRLRFEPGASLSRDAQCRWFFLPFFEVQVE